METLREAIVEDAPTYLAVGGIIIGFIFGFVVYRTNFCTMGSISDILTFGDFRRFRAWLLAAATAIVGAQFLQQMGVVDLGQSMYLAPSFNWFGNLLGGLMFGFGMVFAGGCTSRNLVRAGGGDLRSLMVLLIVGLFAYMTIGGIIGPLRAELQQMTAIDLSNAGLATQSVGDMLAALTGLEPSAASLVVALLIAAALAIYCFRDGSFRGSAMHVLAGVTIGLCVVAGWALTGLAYDEFADTPVNPVSLTYVRPTGDTLEWLQRFTAQVVPGFGVATVIGALAGAFTAAKMAGRFQLATFADTPDTLRNLFGATLMGIGGVVALGCTVGQAITGFSTLALGSMLTFVAIVAGGIAGLKYMERLLLASA